MTETEMHLYIQSLDAVLDWEKDGNGDPLINELQTKGDIVTCQWTVFYRRPDNYRSRWTTFTYYVAYRGTENEMVTLQTESVEVVPSNTAKAYLETTFHDYTLLAFDHVNGKGKAKVVEKIETTPPTFKEYTVMIFIEEGSYSHGKVV